MVEIQLYCGNTEGLGMVLYTHCTTEHLNIRMWLDQAYGWNCKEWIIALKDVKCTGLDLNSTPCHAHSECPFSPSAFQQKPISTMASQTHSIWELAFFQKQGYSNIFDPVYSSKTLSTLIKKWSLFLWSFLWVCLEEQNAEEVPLPALWGKIVKMRPGSLSKAVPPWCSVNMERPHNGVWRRSTSTDC